MSSLITRRADGFPFERVTEAIMICDSNHAQIHAGNAFSLGEVFTIAAGATVDLSVSVPAGTYVQDPVTGLPFRFATYKGYHANQFEVGIAWGVKAAVPQHMALLLGN